MNEDAREYQRIYRLAFPEIVKATAKKSYLRHAVRRRAKTKAWVLVNHARHLATCKKYRADPDNLERRREHNRQAKKRYYRLKPLYRLKGTLSCRLRTALRGATKSASTVELIGCTVAELRDHIQQQFAPGMHWNNHGAWHIDHIQPCDSFDLFDPDEQRRCFNYRNLQPLWAKDNLRKSNKVAVPV